METAADAAGLAMDGPSRRQLFMAALMGGALLAGASHGVAAEVTSGVDVEPLQILTNMFYTSVNYSQTGFYADDGIGRRLGSDLIRPGELSGQPVTEAIGARPTPFDTDLVRVRVNEIVDDAWWRLVSARRFLRAEAPGQKLVDLSPATFTRLFRLAGAIGATETFDPYANEGNFVLGLFALTDFYPMAVRGLTPMFGNDVARVWFGALAGGVGNSAANLRALIVDLAIERPELLLMADRIVLWQDDVAGLTGVDRRIWPGGDAGAPVANLIPVDADGLYPALTPQQVFNILFMSSSTVTSGGFFPEGVNGTIRTSGAI
jgi:hypothetical protein